MGVKTNRFPLQRGVAVLRDGVGRAVGLRVFSGERDLEVELDWIQMEVLAEIILRSVPSDGC